MYCKPLAVVTVLPIVVVPLAGVDAVAADAREVARLAAGGFLLQATKLASSRAARPPLVKVESDIIKLVVVAAQESTQFVAAAWVF